MFEGKRRFLSGIAGIAAFCRDKNRQGQTHHAACYDTSHLHKPQAEVLADIARSGFAGLLTLEYLPQFHDWLASRRLASRRRALHLPDQNSISPDGGTGARRDTSASRSSISCRLTRRVTISRAARTVTSVNPSRANKPYWTCQPCR
ncbi:MAG: hypothetical protein JXA14_13775 [Anaerolineae bacterium]|jgi:hypothetical protein|nr:hypothetical protein [Anaerolineae bacterium]